MPSASISLARHVGALVKLQRRILGLTLAELGRRVDMTPQRLRTIEAGEVGLTLAETARLARALDCDLASLVAGGEATDLGRY